MKKTLKQRMGGCIRGTALIACFIAIWYVASCFTQPIFIPSPIVVWDAIIGLAETGQLQMGLLYSFLRITGASAISMAVAIPLALLIYGVKPVFAGVSDEDIAAQCGDAELMGYAENKEVLDSTAPSVYADMCDIWASLGETVNRKASMTLFDSQYLTPLADKYSSATTNSESAELTEEQKQEIVDYEALLTKSMTVEFVADTAQFKNPDEAYAIMDEFVTIANTLDGAIIQVEGNINARNYTDSGQALSAERAKAVAKYFIACGIDPNRLITVGNGNTKMLVDPGASDAYLNRRTDVFFKIIEE